MPNMLMVTPERSNGSSDLLGLFQWITTMENLITLKTFLNSYLFFLILLEFNLEKLSAINE